MSVVGKDIKFSEVQEAAKAHESTINDFITAALSTTIRKYFDIAKFNSTKDITVAFPINIRYSLPTRAEEVVIGNYFTIQLMNIPVSSDYLSVIGIVHKEMSRIKHSSEAYAIYLLSFVTGTVMPYTLAYKMMHFLTKRVSFQFSNLPGPKAPLVY